MAAKKPLPPIPAKYASLPEPMARQLMGMDERNVLGKAQKVINAGTVVDTGKGLGAQKDLNAPMNTPYVSPADKRRFENQLRIVAERKRRIK